MAYAEEYYSEFKSNNDTFLGRIEIQTDGFVGSTSEITKPGADPVQIKMRGYEENKDDAVIGSELVFTFFVLPADADKYDALFTADYKHHKVIYKEAGVTKWTGYLQPGNLERELFGETYQIQLSATDGLADLKDIEYLNSGVVYTDRVSIMTVVKRCLEFIGFDIDFKVQLGTYEDTAMLSTDLALDKTTIDNRRFIKVVDGRQTAKNCYDVLTEVLKFWNCTLRQSAGNYWIITEHEANSYVHTVTYSTLAVASRVASDLQVDIDAYDNFQPGMLAKVAPVKKTGITFRNRNLGDTLFGAGTTWTDSGFEGVTWTTPDELYVTTTAEAAETVLWVESGNISVTKIDDEDYLSLHFSLDEGSITPSTADIYLKVEILKAGATEYTTVLAWQLLGAATKEYTLSTALSETGNYKVRFSFKSYSAITAFNDTIYEMTLHAVYSGSDVTFDTYMEAVNSSPAGNKTFEDTILFGDTNQDNDIGALKISGVRTDNWRRYGKTDDIPILKLYAFQKLISYQTWKNYIRGEIYDASRNLSPHGYVTLETLLYRWVSVTYSAVNKTWSGELIQVLTADVTYTGEPSALSSVDGESSGESSVTIPAGSAYEPAFSKNTAFNKDFAGSGAATTVSRSDHEHSTMNMSGDVSDVLNFSASSTSDDRGISFNSRSALTADYNDGWLRLNNLLEFTNGVYTAGDIRSAGSFLVDSTRGIKAVTGSYGNVQTVGAGVGTWDGYSIGGRAVFMHDGASSTGIYNDVDNEWLIKTTHNGAAELYYNGSIKITTTNTGVSVTGSVFASGEIEAYDTSDRDLKENIRPMSSVLEVIKNWTTARFWHKKKKRKDIGLIAQEVQKDFPEVVKEDQDGFLMINYGKMIAVVFAAIKEILKRLEKLENG